MSSLRRVRVSYRTLSGQDQGVLLPVPEDCLLVSDLTDSLVKKLFPPGSDRDSDTFKLIFVMDGSESLIPPDQKVVDVLGDLESVRLEHAAALAKSSSSSSSSSEQVGG